MNTIKSQKIVIRKCTLWSCYHPNDYYLIVFSVPLIFNHLVLQIDWCLAGTCLKAVAFKSSAFTFSCFLCELTSVYFNTADYAIIFAFIILYQTQELWELITLETY